MARWEDDPQGDGRSDADRGACTSDGEQMNWLGDGSAGEGGGISHIQNRDLGHPATFLFGDRARILTVVFSEEDCSLRYIFGRDSETDHTWPFRKDSPD